MSNITHVVHCSFSKGDPTYKQGIGFNQKIIEKGGREITMPYFWGQLNKNWIVSDGVNKSGSQHGLNLFQVWKKLHSHVCFQIKLATINNLSFLRPRLSFSILPPNVDLLSRLLAHLRVAYPIDHIITLKLPFKSPSKSLHGCCSKVWS